MMMLLLLLKTIGAGSGAHAEAVPSCVKFIYLDVANKRGAEIPLMACSKIENEVAKGGSQTDPNKCAHIGTLNAERLEKAIDDAAEEMKVYYLAIQEAQKCWLATQLGPSMLPSVLGWAARIALRSDQEVADEKSETAAYNNVKRGVRNPGDLPTRAGGEIVDTQATKICRELSLQQQTGKPPLRPEAKAAYQMGVDVVTHYFLSRNMTESAARGDARAIHEMYRNQPQRRKEEMDKLTARLLDLQRKQDAIFSSARNAGGSVIKFMTDATATKLPFGISPNGVSNDLGCMAEEHIAKARGLLCSVARKTAVIDNYKPGEIFEKGAQGGNLVPNGTPEKVAEVIHENCENGPAKRGDGEVQAVPTPEHYPLP